MQGLAAVVAAGAPTFDALVLLTSAAPQIVKSSLFVALFTKLVAALVNLVSAYRESIARVRFGTGRQEGHLNDETNPKLPRCTCSSQSGR